MVRREKLKTLLTGWPPDINSRYQAWTRRVQRYRVAMPTVTDMNMSYCRFENTSKAMSDCLDAIMNGDYKDLTEYERNGLIDMLAYCDDILHYREDIEEELKVIQSKYD
jgi:hypothetical protein